MVVKVYDRLGKILVEESAVIINHFLQLNLLQSVDLASKQVTT
jgi:hypothetical protein